MRLIVSNIAFIWGRVRRFWRPGRWVTCYTREEPRVATAVVLRSKEREKTVIKAWLKMDFFFCRLLGGERRENYGRVRGGGRRYDRTIVRRKGVFVCVIAITERGGQQFFKPRGGTLIFFQFFFLYGLKRFFFFFFTKVVCLNGATPTASRKMASFSGWEE